MSTKRVLAAVSGGVDSSVAVHLLRQQGYEVEGVILEFSPAHRAAVESARVIAEQMKMPLHVIECHREFEENVILPFCREYREGRTPNPCILCNPSTKFALICKAAAELGFDFVATGHYARVEHQSGGTAVLRKSDCLERDQSYMLYRLGEDVISRLILPLNDAEDKEAVREIARKKALKNAEDKDSQEICFIEDGDDYKAFLRRNGCDLPKGDFVDADGNILGEHQGIIHYTIGQRKGLGISAPHPLYVCGICPEQNTVTLGGSQDLFSRRLTATDVNLISCDSLEKPVRVQAKIRYRHPEQPATAWCTPDGVLHVEFDEPQRAITCGQAVVLYDGETVVGGGRISSAEKS